MNCNCLSSEKRNCPHCKNKNTLQYYHEDNGKDLYYCDICYCIVSWDGINIIKKKGEAYPFRKKYK